MSRYRFVFSWRWIRLHVLIWLILIPAFISLGMWQRGRYHERTAENRVIRTAMNAPPVPIEGVDAVGAAVPQAERWKQLTLVGTFDPAHQFLVRNHQNGGNPGFYVVTPLTLGDGTSVLVNRGWIPTVNTDEQMSPPIPAAPAGTVTVVGRLQQSETKGNTGIRDVTDGLPAGQISLINTASLTAKTGLRLRGGYTEVISMKPADSSRGYAGVQITPVDAPSLDEGPYLSYWFQWWLFGVIAIGAWITIIRREAQHRDREAAEAAEEDEYDEDKDEEEEDGDTEAADGPGNEPGSETAREPETAAASTAATGAAPGTATAPAP